MDSRLFSGYLGAPVLEIGVGHGSYADELRGYRYSRTVIGSK
jgi:hypothetical protein